MAVMLLEWVFTSVFLILVVLALRAALGRRVSAGLRYALWAVVLVRLLVPVQLFTTPIAGTWVVTEKRAEQAIYAPTSPPITQAGQDGALSLGGEGEPSAVRNNFPQAPNPPTVPDPPEPFDFDNLPGWVGYLGWAWLAGSAAVALVFLASNLRFYGWLRRARIALEGADCPLRVYVAVGLPSPCLFGIVRPAVYVTPEAAADPDMLRHVLAHELTHCRHADHLWSLLRCAALAAHWWNPLVWASAVLSRRDAELACDEGALKRLGDGQRAGYGNTLLALVTAKPRPGDLFRCATTMAGDKKSLKERVSRIAAAPKRVVWAVAVAVLVTALACVCAFGQAAEPSEADGPDPSPEPTAGQDVPEVEIAFAHAGNDPASGFAVPEDVLDVAIDMVSRGFRQRAPEGIIRPGWGEYNEETGRWDRVEDLDPDHAARFDRVRISAMEGPWLETCRGVEIETWRINYEYHTTTPEAAENVIVGGMYLTEDGWLCPTYPNCTYLFFQVEGDKRHFLITALKNDCSPESTESGRERFYREVGELLEQRGLAAPSDFPRTDLNRNGVPETLQVYMIDGGAGQRLDVLENGDVIFSEEGYYAHAGYNALFLYRDGGQDYLLRYNPYMGQGWCTYSYKLFTLENGEEKPAREGEIEFDVNFHPLQHQSFEPEAIAAFMDEVNGLLADSVQLFKTDGDLLDTFEKEGRLYDSLGWLDWFEGGFVRDEGKSLLENLRDFQAAMEAEWYAVEPTLFVMNET